ncbi:MAG: hypothetical protein J7K32_06415 [Deltaproteobacteria bacterium]|nr:hypothetical protein [Deltaproteobacteria bacterium]
MQIEYVGEILQDGHLLIPPDIRKRFKVGEKVKVRLRKKVSREEKGLSPQAQELIRLFEEAPDRGGYYGHEIIREFIHEKEDIF